mmetsp:Transcript_20754/g.59286  ORF Transcript_20754/g.59286 Transcript_20754/m.59286 type:complete len:409 (+) Transcript_20754:66-1292(+)|eukprot:CAMPEP_0170210766 /NCGR_PEP_ID=MMETSP0116_2-20130129/4993_1 /TAXON_ID=400756 /ORGANISM="Durinskia baltica, Strain CSIRO CS-38" /LENGTH=408 /DNA_ID=CAMNT_0010461289 /DNA_START=62 /DNA_END=1288 /DNA_ORIENTATION=+
MASAGQAIVLDNGSGTCKLGFAGDGAPRVAIPAAVAWPRSPQLQANLPRGQRHCDGYVAGSDAEAARLVSEGVYALKWPINHGAVVNWDDLEKVWHRAFSDLGVQGGRPILVTEPPLTATAHREHMVQLLFEEFDASAVHVAVSGALSLYATGNRTGLVIEVGDGVSQMLPIYEEYIIPHAVQRLDLGGRDVTDNLMRMLYEERGFGGGAGGTSSAAARMACSAFKEQHCFVAQHYNQELAAARRRVEGGNDPLERTLQLPDGTDLVTAGSERFRCSEILFQPALLGWESVGIHDLAFQAMSKCELDVQKGLCSSVVLAGGTMSMQGIDERIHQELSALVPPSLHVKVQQPGVARDAAFVGGSLLASLSDVQRRWMTREEYEEYGASIIHARSLSLTDGGVRRGGGCA